MNLEYKVKPYKKVDGIYSEPEVFSWRRFWCTLGKFFIKGATGKWELKVTFRR